MKRMLLATVTVVYVAIVVSSAQAINISSASVQSGLAVVSGGKATPNSTISWESGNVAKANKNGGFSFSGVVPADCVGTLSDNGGLTTIDVTLANCTPTPTGRVLKTGQTKIYAFGDDGTYQKGTALPNPRFIDNSNGTITDKLTGLIWLKNANCFGIQPWATAINFANGLAHGACGLSDNSAAGDWRLPNVNELTSLVDIGQFDPVLPSDHPFTDFQSGQPYWSSTTWLDATDTGTGAWTVGFTAGGVLIGTKTSYIFFL